METKKLKIGLFVDAFLPMIDGVTVVVDNYARRLLEYGEVTVFCPQPREKGYQDNAPYRVVRSRKMMIPFTDYDLSTPLFDYHFRKALRRSNLDLVHIHSPFSIGKIGVDYAKRKKIPVIATLHSQYHMDFEQRMKSTKIADMMTKEIMKVFNRCDEMYAVNHQVANIFQTYGANQLPKVRFNGTDLLPLPLDHRLEDFKQEWGVRAGEFVFLFVGRIDAIKNIFFIIEALKSVKKAKLPFKMFFVGAGPDEERLKEAIHSANLTSQVTLVGRIKERNRLAQFYQMADLFVFPSLYDASSLVQIEAASQKTPALFLNGAATADTVTDGVNGFLAENDPILYGRKIVSICQDHELLTTVSQNAFRDLYKTWDEQVKKTIDTYTTLIETHRK